MTEAGGQTRPKRAVTFVCDSGNKYLSKMYNDSGWLNKGSSTALLAIFGRWFCTVSMYRSQRATKVTRAVPVAVRLISL